ETGGAFRMGLRGPARDRGLERRTAPGEIVHDGGRPGPVAAAAFAAGAYYVSRGSPALSRSREGVPAQPVRRAAGSVNAAGAARWRGAAAVGRRANVCWWAGGVHMRCVLLAGRGPAPH